MNTELHTLFLNGSAFIATYQCTHHMKIRPHGITRTAVKMVATTSKSPHSLTELLWQTVKTCDRKADKTITSTLTCDFYMWFLHVMFKSIFPTDTWTQCTGYKNACPDCEKNPITCNILRKMTLQTDKRKNTTRQAECDSDSGWFTVSQQRLFLSFGPVEFIWC